MRQQFRFFFLALSFVLSVTTNALADEPTFTTIDVPGAAFTTAHAINRWGDVVGYYRDAQNVTHGYKLSGGVFTTIHYPGSSDTRAFAINASGTITGEFTLLGKKHGLLVTQGTYQTMDFPSATTTFTFGAGINDRGDIVGRYADNTGPHGFIRMADGSFTKIDVAGATVFVLNAINSDGSAIVGRIQIAGAFHGLFWSAGVARTFDFPDAIGTFAFGITDANEIVGSEIFGPASVTFEDADGDDFPVVVGNVDPFFPGTRTFGFRLSEDGQLSNGWTLISFPGSILTRCLGINASGDIVGRYDSPDGQSHGYLLSR